MNRSPSVSGRACQRLGSRSTGVLQCINCCCLSHRLPWLAEFCWHLWWHRKPVRITSRRRASVSAWNKRRPTRSSEPASARSIADQSHHTHGAPSAAIFASLGDDCQTFMLGLRRKQSIERVAMLRHYQSCSSNAIDGNRQQPKISQIRFSFEVYEQVVGLGPFAFADLCRNFPCLSHAHQDFVCSIGDCVGCNIGKPAHL
jgi:hypothetical protein